MPRIESGGAGWGVRAAHVTGGKISVHRGARTHVLVDKALFRARAGACSRRTRDRALRGREHSTIRHALGTGGGRGWRLTCFFSHKHATHQPPFAVQAPQIDSAVSHDTRAGRAARWQSAERAANCKLQTGWLCLCPAPRGRLRFGDARPRGYAFRV